MMRVMDSKCLDGQLWHACAGGMVQMPAINSKVFYFPQGHAEHSQSRVDFGNSRVPAMILCKVAAIRYMADTETDDVYAKISLVPQSDGVGFDSGVVDEDGYLVNNVFDSPEKPTSFVKTLTQSDANNGGGFSVPRYCAETIFPRLDYSAEPPVQSILVKDVHGEIWKFRHIYRGTPRRHLLTTGWSNFVNQKKLVAGDSIVFLRAENGDLCVGIRRATKGIGGAHEYHPCVRYSRVASESVSEAARLAANGQPFEVVYYPRGNTPEFCVRASAVRTVMQIRWCSGMRFKMPFETEDSSRISWFMGTISSVQVSDPIRWPGSPWRLLQVAWDEPDLLQNVKRVNPWLVELVANMPSISLSPFSPPRKKMRVIETPEYHNQGHFFQGSFPSCIQGARHAQFGSNLYPQFGFQQLCLAEPSRVNFASILENDDNISYWLKIGHSESSLKSDEDTKTPHLLLFGQVILTKEQLSKSSSGGENSSSEGNVDKPANVSDGSGSTLRQSGSRENYSDDGASLI